MAQAVGLNPDGDAPRLTPIQWLICTIAAIGFAFDIYELLMLPLVFRPAFIELSGLNPTDPAFREQFSKWLGMLFYIPAFAGGAFGLIGGYLTDRLGRRRVLTWSILLYAFGAFFAGFSTSLWMLLVFRCAVFIGVCIEFVAAVAWLAELFPEPRRREKVLGTTQAFSSIGGLLVAYAGGLAVAWGASLPAIQLPEWLTFGGTIRNPHAAWRYTLMSGLIPAIPLLIIRPFLPESPAWQKKKAAGTLRRPSLAELFRPALLRTTVVTTIMFACSYGAAFGAIQMMPQIVPGLPEVRAQIAEAQTAVVADDVPKIIAEQMKGKDESQRAAITAKVTQQAKARVGGEIGFKAATDVSKIQEYGGLTGRVLLAVLAVYIISRQRLIRIFQVPGLIVMPIVFGYAAVTGLISLKVGMFFAGLLTVAQFSFWGNYLPRVYPLHLRGTGESFAANIGGRMIGTSFAWVTATIAGAGFWADHLSTPTRFAYTAAGVGVVVYFVGLICSFFLPEPGIHDNEGHDHAPAVAQPVAREP